MKRIIEINGKKYKRIAERNYPIPKSNDLKPYIRKYKIDLAKFSMDKDDGGPFLKVLTKKGNFLEVNDEMIELVVKGKGYVKSYYRFGGSRDKQSYHEAFRDLKKADEVG